MRRRVVRRLTSAPALVLGLASAGCSTLQVWHVRTDPCVHPLFVSKEGAKVFAYTTSDNVRTRFDGRARFVGPDRLQFDESGRAERAAPDDFPTTFTLPRSGVESVEYRAPDEHENAMWTGFVMGALAFWIVYVHGAQ